MKPTQTLNISTQSGMAQDEGLELQLQVSSRDLACCMEHISKVPSLLTVSLHPLSLGVFTESQNGLEGTFKGLVQPLPRAGTPSAQSGCSGRYIAWKNHIIPNAWLH